MQLQGEKKHALRVKRMVRLALLTALGAALSGLEHQLPPLLPALPGARIGLGNLPTLVALYLFGFPSAFTVSVLRSLVAGLLFASPVSVLYSLCGGALATLVMGLCKRIGWFSMMGVSMVGALFHHVGQLGIAVLLTQSPGVFAYLPYLSLYALPTGLFIGYCGMLVKKAFERYAGRQE